ncbi:hypothetical protein D3C80_1920500 [compost metagenome]
MLLLLLVDGEAEGDSYFSGVVAADAFLPKSDHMIFTRLLLLVCLFVCLFVV